MSASVAMKITLSGAILCSLARADWPENKSVRYGYKEEYPSWSRLFGVEPDQYNGYEWDVLVTETNEGWTLTTFKITPEYSRLFLGDVVDQASNVLMMHGMQQDAESWFTGYFVGTPMPLKLVDAGYTVYMANARGTKYSAKNENIADRASEEYWDFDFRDMGVEDLPAFVSSIRTVSSASIRYIGYDMGNMQMFYGLTQLEEYWFASRISSFVALAPCIFTEPLVSGLDYAAGVGAYRGLGVYAVNGPNWESDLAKICDNLSGTACTEAKLLAKPGIPISVKNLEYLRQLGETKRYQIYATSEEYLANPEQPLIEGVELEEYPYDFDDTVPVVDPTEEEEEEEEEEEPVVDPTEDIDIVYDAVEEALSSIGTVPTFLLAANEDKRCTLEQAQWVASKVGSTRQLLTYTNADHDFFTWSNQKVFMEETLSFVAGATVVILASAVQRLVNTTVTISILLAFATL